MTLLVAEDNSVNAQVIGIMLKNIGYKHVWCHADVEVVAEYDRNGEKYDMIIMGC